MPRTARLAPGGMVFHVLNRGVGQMQIFERENDYDAFRRVVDETLRLAPTRICAYCWMPNHWHFVLWPQHDGDLSRFMQRMANMHTQRWQRAKGCVGHGHLYQGRFKSFPVESDDHFYAVVRYVERNALRAGLVERAEDWPWGSLHQRAPQHERSVAGRLAVAATARLGGVRQLAPDRGGTRRHPAMRSSGEPLRRAGLDKSGGDTTGAAIDPQSSGAPAHTGPSDSLLDAYYPIYAPVPFIRGRSRSS